MSDTDTPEIVILPTMDDCAPDAIELSSYAVLDMRTGNLIGFIGYVPHMDVWAYQAPDNENPIPAMDEDLMSNASLAVKLLIDSNPF